MMVSKISTAVAAVVAVLFVIAGGGGGKRAGRQRMLHQMPASSASPKSIQLQVSLQLSQSLGTGGVGCAHS